MESAGITKRIEIAMMDSGVSNRDMAKRLGISERQWQNLKRYPQTITLGRLLVICARLKIEPKELFTGVT